jgi:hypothetical protein
VRSRPTGPASVLANRRRRVQRFVRRAQPKLLPTATAQRDGESDSASNRCTSPAPSHSLCTGSYCSEYQNVRAISADGHSHTSERSRQDQPNKKANRTRRSRRLSFDQ